MVHIQCPSCQTVLGVEDGLAGEVVSCSQCGTMLRVPAADAAPPPNGDDGGPQDPIAGMKPDSEPPTEGEVVEEAIAPRDAEVLAELERLQKRRPSWWGALAILVISLLLFMGAAQAGQAWEGIFILIPVIFFHELGHYVAMQCFGYRNVQMFFIPFFGAAVSGQHYNVAGWKKAVVALAGPVPGILIGAPLGVAGLVLDEPKVGEVALLLLILNGFNLLPFLPLDGGWVVHSVLFVRHPLLDGVFRLGAALGLGGLALLMESWLLIALAASMLVALPIAWKLARVAHRLKRQGLAARPSDAEAIPAEVALSILAEVRPALPAQTTPKVMAQHVANVFETLNAHPPGGFASLGLLAVHAGSFLLALVMSVVLSALGAGGAPPVTQVGEPVTAATRLEVGKRVVAFWGNHWWAAEVLAVQPDGQVRIHYAGWDARWDEVVPRNRLRLPPGPAGGGKEDGARRGSLASRLS